MTDLDSYLFKDNLHISSEDTSSMRRRKLCDDLDVKACKHRLVVARTYTVHAACNSININFIGNQAVIHNLLQWHSYQQAATQDSTRQPNTELWHAGLRTAVILLWYYACFITCRPEKNVFFYNKTLRSTNIVLRVVCRCRLHLYEAQTVFSLSCFFPGHTGNVDIKRAVCARSASVFWFWFYCFSFNFSSVVVCIFHFYCSVFLVFVLPSGVIKNDYHLFNENK